MPAHSFDPVGTCIYCGIGGCLANLTDEHVVPFSLGGDVILPQASCKACAAITSGFELTIARKIFGTTRVHLQMPTRRPKDRPTSFSLKRTLDGVTTEIDVAADEFPVAFGLPIIPGPGILTGEPPLQEFKDLIVQMTYAERVDRSLDSFGPGAHVDATINISSIARLTAKIGLGLAVGHLGYENIEPIVRDLILGRSDHFNTFVGATATRDHMVSMSGEGRWIHQASLVQIARSGRKYVAADIRLFANLFTPRYRAVVAVVK